MCVAAPGKIIALNGNTATIEYESNIIKADTGIVNVKEGDWVLVHAGLVIQVLSDSDAQSISSLLSEIEDMQ